MEDRREGREPGLKERSRKTAAVTSTGNTKDAEQRVIAGIQRDTIHSRNT